MSITAASSTVVEGSPAVFVLTAKEAPFALIVDVELSATGDFGVESGPRTVEFEDDEATVTLSVRTEGNDVIEAWGTVAATVQCRVGYLVGEPATAEVTIADDDVTMSVAAEELTVVEGDPAVFVVSASGTPLMTFMVEITLDATGDFGAVTHPRSVVFEAGTPATTATLRVATRDDGDVEPAGTVTATIEPGFGYTPGASSTVSVAVADNDVRMSLAAGASTVVEGNSAVFFLTLSEAAWATFTVEVAYMVEDASGVATGTQMVVFAAGEAEATFSIDTEGDEDVGAAGMVTVTLPAGSGYALGASAAAEVMVADDDVEISITALVSSLTEGDQALFLLSASEEPHTAFTANVALTPTGDFGVATGTRAVVFKAGDETRLLRVETGDDDVVEAPGTLTATMESGFGYAVDTSSPVSVSVTVTDDDVAISITARAPTVAEGDPAQFVLIANEPPPTALTVDVALSGADGFGVIAGTRRVAFEKGVPTATLPVNTLGDEDVKAWGTLTATVRGGLDYRVGASSTASVTVADDDVSISIASQASTVAEGAQAEFILTASEPPLSAFTVEVTLSATGDFDVATGTQSVVFEAGATTTPLSVKTRGNDVVEADGTLTATVQGGFGYTVGSPATVSVAIADDHDRVSIRADTPIVAEGSPAIFVLAVGEAQSTAFTVNVDINATGEFGVTPGSRPAVFEAGTTTATLHVETQGDETVEAAGTITAIVQNGTDYAVGSPSTAEVTVADNDVTISLTTLASSVGEGSPAIFVLTASEEPLTTFTINIELSSQGDFGASTGTRAVVFEAGERAEALGVITVDDDIDEANGVVRAALQTGFGYAVGEPATASVAVADNDVAISVAAASSLVEEGNPAVFVLTASEALPPAFTVDVEVSSTGDFGVATGTRPVVFEMGGPTATLSVPTEGDRVAEVSGTVTATLQAGVDYVVGTPATASVTIADDDEVGPFATSTPGAVFRECADCPEMVVVPAGTFTMGSPESEGGRNDERPQHEVTIPQFAVGRYEVTFAEWDACHAAGGCTHNPRGLGRGRGRQPVIRVSWDDAQEYVAWLSREAGGTYRLLTESEWEYAARAGTTTRYHWGDEVGVGNARCGACESNAEFGTRPVGSYAANAFGLYDMSGNVWEWVEDCYHSSYGDADGNVTAPLDGTAWEDESVSDGNCAWRVLRGGSWVSGYVHSANRNWDGTGYRLENYGFRVARTLEEGMAADEDVTISIAASSSLVVEGDSAVFVLRASEWLQTALTVNVAVGGGVRYGVTDSTRMVEIGVGSFTATLSVETQGDNVAGAPGMVTATVESGVGYAIGAPATAEVEISNGDANGADGSRFRECVACPEMVVVRGGTFTMGSPASEGGDDSERPQHEVTISRFAVGRYEVTFAEWDACYDAGGCTHRPRDEGWVRGRPVFRVSWDDAQEYVEWLSGETGKTYRLLSGSEWEYAARAGTTTRYHWGDEIGVGNARCYGCLSPDHDDWEDGYRPVPVGSYPANAFGLYDMSGNVQEWVEDCWHGSYGDEEGNVTAPLDGSAWGSEDGGDCAKRVLRGGPWLWDVRSAARAPGNADVRYDIDIQSEQYEVGFRVARTLAESPVADEDVTIAIAASSSLVVEGDSVVFVLTASEAAGTAFTVEVAVSGVDRYGVTTSTPTVVFGEGEFTATLSVGTEGDEVPEASATVTATLQDGADYTVGASSTASVTIVDDDGGGRFRECAVCPEMVVVPGGTFTMGSPASEGGDDSERPQHEVTIPRFAVGRYEVTFAEWDACHAAHVAAGDMDTGCRNPVGAVWRSETRPVIRVNREKVKEYVTWLSRETGETYRLLSESEWEYAARAGTTTRYHWGDEVGVGNANCNGCGGAWDPPAEGSRRAAPVGSYPANAFGLYDMSGNVWEWVEDCWHDSYGDEEGNVTAPLDGSAWGSEDGGDCDNSVIRGGSWYHLPRIVRSAYRALDHVTVGDYRIGFRVARTLPAEPVADEDVTITIAASSSLVVEGNPAVFVLTASEALPPAFTVDAEVSATGDFGVATGTQPVVFGMGGTTAILSVATEGDGVPEIAGTVTATLQAGVGYVVGTPAIASVAIADDDLVVHATSTPGAVFRECPFCPVMMVVPGGTFTMGSPESEEGRQSDEGPQHEVTIDYRFAVGRYEVTFAEWDACHAAHVAAGDMDTGCVRNPEDGGWGRGTRPVINVSWNDAKEYVAWLSEETSETYRLLTESEWEYAARAGTTTAYHWGDDVEGGNSDKANCALCVSSYREQTAEVGSYDPNDFGLYDMSGNVHEWVEDCWHDNYTGAPVDGTAWEGEDGGNCARRVMRGGPWNFIPQFVRSASRYWGTTGVRHDTVGFRIARTLEEGAAADEDVTISIAASSSLVVEGSPAVFVLTASEALPPAFAVDVEVSATGDFGVATGTQPVVFEEGATEATLRVATEGDEVVEAAGTVTVTLRAGSSYAVGTPAEAEVMVADNDVMVSITALVSSVMEGDLALFILSASEAPQTAFTANVALTTTGDFGVATGTPPVVFAVGDETRLLRVETGDDDVIEAPGMLTATIENGFGYTADASPTASVTISDDDVAISITAQAPTVAEGDPAQFVLTASETPPTALMVDVMLSGAAGFGVMAGTRKVAFEEGEPTATLRVNTRDDEVVRAAGTVTATVRGGFGYRVGATSTASVTVADNDVSISIAASSSLVVEGDSAAFVLTASAPPLTAFTVAVAISGAGDFGAATGTQEVVFGVGETRATLSVATVSDGDVAADGTLTATVRDGIGYRVGMPSVASVTIVDDHARVSIRADTPIVAEGSPAVFVLTVSEAPLTAFTVNVALDAKGDFGVTPDADPVVFGVGTTTATLSVDTEDDDVVEAAGTLTAMVQGGADYAIGASSTAAVTVADNDVTVSIGTFMSPVEEGSPAVFVLTTSDAPLTAFAVNVEISAPPGFGVATGTRTVVFEVGERADALGVITVDDDIDEANGIVTAALRAGFGYSVDTPATAEVIVADNDVTISIAAASSSLVVEGDSAVFVLTANEALPLAFTVNVEVSSTGDFGVATGTQPVVFGMGGTTATLSVITKGDDVAEIFGTVTVTLQAGAGYRVGVPAGAEVRIEDDDEAGLASSTSLMAGVRFRDCADCPEMVVVPGGTFTMGSPIREASTHSWERPQHEVTIPRFAVGRYEVTFAEWDACHAAHVAAGDEDVGCTRNPGDNGWGRGNRPVMNVSWSDAKEYVAWLSRETGERYRLLTESEWEYAARAGTQTAYHWGDDVEGGNSGKANCNGCESSYRGRTAEVGSFEANAFGLYDMSGNVWEWVEDCWHGSYGDEEGNVTAPLDGSSWEDETVSGGRCDLRVLRGGSWFDRPEGVRSAFRNGFVTGRRFSFGGFRIARTLP